jgi:hypothetical protein
VSQRKRSEEDRFEELPPHVQGPHRSIYDNPVFQSGLHGIFCLGLESPCQFVLVNPLRDSFHSQRSTTGLTFGLGFVVLVNRTLRGVIAGLGTESINAMWIAACLVLFTTALACWLPVSRATNGDPMSALRQDLEVALSDKVPAGVAPGPEIGGKEMTFSRANFRMLRSFSRSAPGKRWKS